MSIESIYAFAHPNRKHPRNALQSHRAGFSTRDSTLGEYLFSLVSTRAKYLLKESPEYGGIYLCGNAEKATRSGG